jgi:Fe2+ or Zn2+ uptake regulation protein
LNDIHENNNQNKKTRGKTMKNTKTINLETVYNNINKFNEEIENLMNRVPDGNGYVVDGISVKWFIDNKCDTLELVTKEYIKWYFEMGEYWLGWAPKMLQLEQFGKKLVNDLKNFITNNNL